MNNKVKWQSKIFEDKPHYARLPIFFGGERQIHIMQPFDERPNPRAPKTVNEWAKKSEKHGQIVFSVEALPDFIQALQEFVDTQIRPQMNCVEKQEKKCELKEDDPLWFLKHNPRAYGEVKNLIKHQQEALVANDNGSDFIAGKYQALVELLDIVEKDM